MARAGLNPSPSLSQLRDAVGFAQGAPRRRGIAASGLATQAPIWVPPNA